jgi:hypothetical protein
MKIHVTDKLLLILFESSDEESLVRNHFTIEDMSNVYMGGKFDIRKIKKKCFLKKKKPYHYLNSGYLKELLTLAKGKIKVTELQDKRTKFNFQKKQYKDEELKNYLPNFDYVEHQVDSLRRMLRTNVGIIQAPTSSGKCFARGTKVIMFDGTLKNVEDVIVGDKLLGSDSKKRNVLSTHNGKDTLYRINQYRANSYVVNSEHLLCLKITGGAKLGKIKNGEYINISVKDYLNKSKYFKHCAKGYKSSLLNFKYKKTSKLLTPYLLGLWLGDGRNNNITITNIDKEIISYLNEFTQINDNLELIEYNYGEKASSYHIKDIKKGKDNRLLNELKKYNLLNNKHIPTDYKINSEEVRLSVLAGLIDSDGYLDKKFNKLEITLKDEKLANDVIFITQSLGFHSILNECYKSAHKNHIGKYFRIYISGDIHKIPTKIDRKKAKNKKMRTDCLLHGISNIEQLNYGEYFGFSVDGDNKFLLNDFTVVHNSETIIAYLKLSKLPTLILVNKVSLALQLRDRITNNGIKNVGLCYGKGMIDGDVIVSTIGSVGKIPALHKFKVLIIDEVHGAAAGRFQDFLSKAPYPLRFGFSATPNSGNKYKWNLIKQYMGDIIYEIEPEPLMKNKVLAKPKIEFIPIESPPTIDWPSAYQNCIVNNDKRNNKIRNLVEEYNVPTLILIRIIEHGEILNEAIDGSVFVSGVDDAVKRQEVIDDFEKGNINTVISSNIFNEGISINAIRLLIIASGGKSKIETIQKLGRGLRIIEGKSGVLVFDFEDYGNYFTEKHSKLRKSIYKKAGFEVAA